VTAGIVLLVVVFCSANVGVVNNKWQ